MEQVKETPMRSRRSRQQILEILKSFEQSGVTVTEFCRARQIHPSNFHKWRSRYKSRSPKKATPSGFASVDIIESTPAPSCLFCEVKGIKIYQVVSATFLKELIK